MEDIKIIPDDHIQTINLDLNVPTTTDDSLGIELFQGRHVETLIIENERRLEVEKIKKVNENEEENDDKKDTSTRGKEAAGKPGKK